MAVNFISTFNKNERRERKNTSWPGSSLLVGVHESKGVSQEWSVRRRTVHHRLLEGIPFDQERSTSL
ncbi:hypothetical protein V1477_015873 [Vespula maculifrons]|uniref:DUF4113 domain-containing protein n=1 Tax=Vespula maculifrons TaxID=7453 RepID=A0ABD2BBE2_VESMC